MKDGKINVEIIDQRVEELLNVVLAEKPKAKLVDEKAQHDAARKAAEQCIVLLKNDQDILPLQHSAKVAMIGDFAAHPRYQGRAAAWSMPGRWTKPWNC